MTHLRADTHRPLIADVVVVARDQADQLPATLDAIPTRVIRSVVVVDNGSTDATAQVARDAGCVVLRESRRGYGAACQRARAHLAALPRPPDVVVFVAADGSADPADIPALLGPIFTDNAELVIGIRPQGSRRPATRVALSLIGAIYRHRFADLSPMRAIRFAALTALGMSDPSDGWNAEMQVKALKLGLHVEEVPVSERARPEGRSRRERATARVRAGGRTLFQILRHSTTR